MVEIVLGLACVALAAWPLTRWCAGFPLTYDCESWHIFGLNLFGPFGAVALACGWWDLRTHSRTPPLVLAATGLILLARLGLYALL